MSGSEEEENPRPPDFFGLRLHCGSAGCEREMGKTLQRAGRGEIPVNLDTSLHPQHDGAVGGYSVFGNYPFKCKNLARLIIMFSLLDTSDVVRKDTTFIKRHFNFQW